MRFLLRLAPSATLVISTAASAAAGTSPPLWSEANLPFDQIVVASRSPKDQFETSSAYEKRKCEAIADMLNAKPGTPLTFRLKSTTARFDADRQVFILESLSRAPGPDLWRGGQQYVGALYLDVATREGEKPGYRAQNAYGVSRQIQVREGHYVVLSLARKQRVEPALTVLLPVKASEARALHGDLQVELVSRLKAPCAYYESHREDPTIQSPVQELSHVYELHLDRAATTWRVVRTSTGEVLKAGKL